jgi:hypothetical protein
MPFRPLPEKFIADTNGCVCPEKGRFERAGGERKKFYRVFGVKKDDKVFGE